MGLIICECFSRPGKIEITQHGKKPAHRAGAASLHNLTALVNNAMRVCASAGYGTC
jgi:hypothetical protein